MKNYDFVNNILLAIIVIIHLFAYPFNCFVYLYKNLNNKNMFLRSIIVVNILLIPACISMLKYKYSSDVYESMYSYYVFGIMYYVTYIMLRYIMLNYCCGKTNKIVAVNVILFAMLTIYLGFSILLYNVNGNVYTLMMIVLTCILDVSLFVFLRNNSNEPYFVYISNQVSAAVHNYNK